MNRIVKVVGVGFAIASLPLAGCSAGAGDAPLPTVTAAAQTVTVTAPAVTAIPTERTVTATVTSVATVLRTVKAAPPAPAASIDEGTWEVGSDVTPGTYRTTETVGSDCYWKISRTGSNGDDIISNDIPGGGRPRVTLRKGQDFATQGCGTWAKAS